MNGWKAAAWSALSVAGLGSIMGMTCTAPSAPDEAPKAEGEKVALAAETVEPQRPAVRPGGPPANEQAWRANVIAEGIDRPWGLVWLPDGRILLTEKSGRISTVENGQYRPGSISGGPQVFSGGQGGLMDVALHPNFAQNGWVYFTYSTGNNSANRTVLGRGVLRGNRIEGLSEIFRVSQSKDGGQHFGSRLVWLPDGTLLMSVGDGGNPPTRLEGGFIREQAQNRQSHLGKVLRLTQDGKPAPGNPFGNEVWSYGHRNIQGLVRDSQTGRIWANEHGAGGGDEVNLLAQGKNFGWPKATFSHEYWGPAISDHTSLAGMVDPVVVWTPSTGPSGLAILTSDRYGRWKGDLFSGGLASRDVRRIDLDAQGRVLGQTRMDIGQRVRDVRQGPDGFLYVITDEGNGRLIRLEAVDR